MKCALRVLKSTDLNKGHRIIRTLSIFLNFVNNIGVWEPSEVEHMDIEG